MHILTYAYVVPIYEVFRKNYKFCLMYFLNLKLILTLIVCPEIHGRWNFFHLQSAVVMKGMSILTKNTWLEITFKVLRNNTTLFI